MTEMIESNAILEVTDDEGAINLLISLKCTVIVADPGHPFEIHHTPQATSSAKPRSKRTNKRQRRPQTTIIKKIMQLHASQGFNTEIWWFSSHPQNMFKMIPQFSELENIAFVKG